MKDQGQFDAQTLHYMADNAEAEHLLLSPLRWLIAIGKTLVIVFVLTCWFSFTLLGWIFNVGGYSLENRREKVCDPAAYLHLCDEADVYRLEKNSSDLRFNLGHGYPDRVRGDQDIDIDFSKIKSGDISTALRGWVTFSSGSDFFERSDDSFRRKSARMLGPLRAAVLSTEELQRTIALARHEEKEDVHLTQTPVVIVRYVLLPGSAADIEHNVYGISGMCLANECAQGDLDFHLTRYADIWAKTPPLSPHQVNAIAALWTLSSEDYWLQTAHENGVRNDGMIMQAYELFRQSLKVD